MTSHILVILSIHVEKKEISNLMEKLRSTTPAAKAQWTARETDTESPIIHTINETTPITYAYRTRYIGKNVKFGPFDDPVVCTVSV